MSEEMKQVPIDLSHVFELLSNKKNDILDIDYSNDNDSYPTVRAVKNYVDDLQTILNSKASTADLIGGLQYIGAFTIHTVYNVNGSTSAFDVSSGLSYAQQTPVFFLVKNNIGDNEANATLKYYPNGNNISIMDAFSSNSVSPIQQGVWKKDTWGLFFCAGNNNVQLRSVFYDSVDIDEKSADLSKLELIDSTHSLASTSNWTGTSTRLRSLTKGTRILYRITYVPTATSQGATLSIKFTDNTHSGYKRIIFADGTEYNAKWFISSIAKNDVLLLEYDGTNWVLLDFFAIGERPKVARTGSYNDLSDKPTIPTIVDNLTTDDATKALSAKQGKVLNDLIGDAINYINGTGGN